MATYTLTDGTRKTQLTINGDTTVVFPTKLDYFGVRSLDGANILVSKIKAPTTLEDGVYSTDEGDGDVVVDDGIFTDTLYLKGSGTVVVYGGTKPGHLPFKKSGKGGGDEGSLRMLGATTTALTDGATTNPITIDGESVTAVKNDVAIYNTREFYFSGTTWSEFGGTMDTVPTSGSANAVTSDGIYRNTAGQKEYVNNVLKGEKFNNAASASGSNSHAEGDGTTASNIASHAEGQNTTASNLASHAEGDNTTASGLASHAEGGGATASGIASHAEGQHTTASGIASHAGGKGTQATQANMTAIGKYNSPRTGDLFNVGNGTADNKRSNIVEVNSAHLNVNGDIQANGTSIITQYATMPTITANMVGKVVQYVGTTDSTYTKGWNYVAVSDGAAEPTYSWAALMDSTPTSGSNNPVTSDGIYKRTPLARGGGSGSAIGGANTTALGNNSFAFGQNCVARGTASVALGHNILAQSSYGTNVGAYNVGSNSTLFEIGNGTGAARSNILEVNSTSLNVNGDIQINNVSIPTPYTTMPTITAEMLGQIAQYVGATTSNYIQGHFYIAASDGAAEPTYYWKPVDKPAYTLTTLWEYDGVDHIDTAGTVICSEAELAEYDFVGLFFGFRNMTSGDLTGQYSFAPTTAMPEVLISTGTFATTANTYYNGRIGINNGDLKILSVSNNIYTDQSITFRMGIYRVVAVKFGVSDAALAQSGYRETVLWENDGTTNPASITLSSAYTNFDALILVGGNFGLADHVYMSTHVYPTSALSIANTTAIIGFGDDGAFTWYNVASTTSLTFRQGSLRIMKIIGVNY